MELVEWLTSVLDEDEKWATWASDRSPEWDIETAPQSWGEEFFPDIIAGGKPIFRTTEYSSTAGWHIVGHDPAAVLADIAAKRAIIARFTETAPPYASARQQEIHETLRDEVIGPLASAYAHRDGFDSSWA